MNSAMSLKARIRGLARTNKVPAQAVLQSYMLERLLERVSLSRFKNSFILKGGLLISSMIGINNRTTMDMDATVKNYPLTEESIHALLLEVCAISIADGVSMEIYNVESIRAEDEYGGFRVSLNATYDEIIRAPLKVDITTDDIITPGAVTHQFATLFDNRYIELWAYNIETVLAEKYETILRRGVLNTRARDFYDVYSLYGTKAFDHEILRHAILATVEKRGSAIFLSDSASIFTSIRQDEVMRQRWNVYCKEYPYASGIDFDAVLDVLEKLN